MVSRFKHIFTSTTRPGTIAIILLILMGIVITWYTIIGINKEMKRDLLESANIAAGSINKDRLSDLTGTTEDLSSDDYKRIKEQLITMREANPRCKFLYLMGRNDNGEVFFYVDAQTEDSQDYAPPGLIYKEVSPEYIEIFNNPQKKTVGPVKDRWGKLMTALIPIKKENSDELLALLGMDMTSDIWISEVFQRTIPIIILIILSVFLVYYIQHLRMIKYQKKAEKKIQDREERYKALFDQAADGILIGNEQGNIIDANKSICMISGYSKEELIGSNIKLLFSARQLRENPLNYQSVLNGKTVLNERKLTRKDGTSLIIEMNTRKVGDGRLQAFIRDITQRKRAEQMLREKNEELTTTEEKLKTSNEELRMINDMLAQRKEELEKAKERAEESDKLKSVFLANMSHEIRTPMNGIIGFSEILTDESFSIEERKEYLYTINSLAQNLMQLIDDIIDISKIEANQLNISREVFYINDLMEELEKVYKMRISKNNEQISLNLHKSFDNEENKIYTDISRLKQILNNLLGNALKYTEKGNIDFGYELNNNREWLFWVKDTGIGIPEKEQVHIFERFRQANVTENKFNKGNGLGLTISKNLVELLGGKIWLESEPGKGSAFYFTIPHQKRKTKIKLPETQSQEAIQWKGKTILIVEDDLPSREYLKRVLKPSGAKLIAFDTGEKGFEEFSKNKNIDLILMDIRLPGMDGTEVIKKIRKNGSQIPIIAQTAHSMNEDRRKYLEAGATDYIAKPIAISVLLSMMKKYL